jgi:serine protease Do
MRLGTAGILDDIMALGYPRIPGFHNILVAQTARIAGHLEHLHSTTGEVVDRQRSYLGGDYLLMSARVKGGSSGGPVINKSGKVVGIVSASPSSDSEEVDRLGFGLAIPSDVIGEFLSNVRMGSKEIRDVPFSQNH